jgi:hypothetical protein
MSISRRNVLKVLGTGAVIVAAGAGGFAMTREPTAALAPWGDAAGVTGDVRVRALAHAILAPNPHNRQPWLVDLGTPGEATLYCQLDRRLPDTDPFDRQITIGLGCFLELLRMAAAEFGASTEITPFPDGVPGERLDRKAIARIKFIEDGDVSRDPLFGQIFKRRTNRESYDSSRPLSNQDLAALEAFGDGDAGLRTSNTAAMLGDLRALTSSAFQVEIDTPRTFMESVDLMRIGKSEINANPDGLNLRGPMIEALYAVGLLTRDQLADVDDPANKTVIAEIRNKIESAMGYFWITTPDDSRLSQLEAGRLYMRAGLQVTEQGLAMQPLSQALQEYPEMDGHYSDLHNLLGVEFPNRVQMLARLGYADQVGPSPRWPVLSRIIAN